LKEIDELKRNGSATEKSPDSEHIEKMKLEEIDRLASVAVDALEEKKAVDVEVLKVTTKTTLADIFVVATGTSNTHIKTLADFVEEKLKEINNITPHHIEGLDARNWVLLDYGDLVVHLMLEEDRMFYNLESLWRLGTQRP
jgi:ribosome-associated protein